MSCPHDHSRRETVIRELLRERGDARPIAGTSANKNNFGSPILSTPDRANDQPAEDEQRTRESKHDVLTLQSALAPAATIPNVCLMRNSLFGKCRLCGEGKLQRTNKSSAFASHLQVYHACLWSHEDLKQTSHPANRQFPPMVNRESQRRHSSRNRKPM